MPVADFGGFVASNIEVAWLIGERLGAGFDNVKFINSLLVRFPELSRSQAGRLASIAIRGAQLAREVTQGDPDTPFAPADAPSVPGLFGDDPGDLRFRVQGYVRVYDPVTKLTSFRWVSIDTATPFGFSTIYDVASQLAADLLSPGLIAAGFSNSIEVVGIEIHYIIGGG